MPCLSRGQVGGVIPLQRRRSRRQRTGRYPDQERFRLPAQTQAPAALLSQREHLAGPGGLEPPTFPIGGSCPIHLGHRPIRDAGRGRTGKRWLCGPSPAPARTAPWHARPDSNGRLAVRNRACYPLHHEAWSVREESNLHAEATGLRPAERTTCSTHGWGALPESNRPCGLHGPVPSRDGKRHRSIRQDSNLRHPVCGTGALAWLSY